MPASTTPALADLAPLLRCPYCGGALAPAPSERALVCARGHSHDVARQGYVTLLAHGGRRHPGDTAAMVAAREAFLAAGHFDRLTAAVVDAARDAVAAAPVGIAVDLGAGTGRQLAALLDALPGWEGLALDASRAALQRAARAHPRMAAVGCDAWAGLPLADGAADLVLNVFAPRNGPELARVLAPGGALVVVTPTARHLAELVAAAGLLAVDADKRERVQAALGPHLRSLGRRSVEHRIALERDDLRRLVAMGPSAWHLTAEALDERVAALPPSMTVTVSVEIETLRRRG